MTLISEAPGQACWRA